MIKSKKYLIVIAVVLGSLLVIPLLIPFRAYLDQAEQIAAQKAGVPVTLKAGYLRLFPTPRLVVEGVTVGHQQEIMLESFAIVPEITSLFTSTPVIDVKVDTSTVKQTAVSVLQQITAASNNAGHSPKTVHIRHIDVNAIRLDWKGRQLPAIAVNVDLNTDNTLQSARLQMADDALNVDVKPEGTGYAILIRVNRMTLPGAVPVQIEQATVQMMLDNAVLDIPHLEAALYGGSLKGNAQLSWSKDWRASGKFQINNLSLNTPSRLVSPAVYLSGSLTGSGRFSATADTATALVNRLMGDIKFDVKNGVLHGLDLAALASLLTKQTKGGNTQFDAFSGNLNIRGKQYTLHDIHLRSGLLTATGQVKVKSDKALDGLIEVALKKGVNLAEVPLQISGTVDTPAVMPTKAAMAGAAAGTAILGPGIGTSLGLKAGGAIDKVKGLFQRD